MIPFNVEKHFIISDEVAEPHGIIFSVVWVNHCGINYSLQTSFKNLCTTCDKFLVSSYTRQLLLCWLGEQAAQHNLHKAPISKTPRGGWHTPAASHWDFLQWEQKTQIQEGFWKENSFSTCGKQAHWCWSKGHSNSSQVAEWQILIAQETTTFKYIFFRTGE